MKDTHDSAWRCASALLLSAFCTSVLGAATGPTASAAPAVTAQQQADKTAILDYPLSMGVIERLAQVSRESAAAHVACTDESDLQGTRSLDAMVHTPWRPGGRAPCPSSRATGSRPRSS